MLSIILALAAAGSPQDVVVMRRQIARPAPAPVQTPAPTPTAAPSYRWDAGQWSSPTASQCPQDLTRTRSVRCLDGTDAEVDGANCQGERPEASETVVDYTSCAVNYSCQPWEQDKQGSGGPHYLVYDGPADATEEGRRTRAQKLCEAQPHGRDIQICTSTVLEITGQPDRLRVFASRGYAINQAPNSRIDSTTWIRTSSIAMCTRIN